MMSFRTMLGAAGTSVSVPVDWSLYDSTGDKSPVEFSFNAVGNVNAIPIDDSRILLVYSAASSCRARIASVDSSGNVTFGTETVVLSELPGDVKADLLDATHAIVAIEAIIPGDVEVVVIEFSGTSIDTVGSAVLTETVSSDHLSIAGLSSTAFFVAYEDLSDTNGTLFYATVSGTVITMGNGIDFETSAIDDINMIGLTGSTAIIAAGHSGTSDGEAYLISVSGITPQVDDALRLINGPLIVTDIGIAKISDTQVIISYTETFTNKNCEAVIVTESGGTLSKGTTVEFLNVISEEQSIALPDTTHAVITLGRNNIEIQTTVIEINGTILTPLLNHQNISGDKESVTNGQVGQKFVLSAYKDENDSGKGKVLVLGV